MKSLTNDNIQNVCIEGYIPDDNNINNDIMLTCSNCRIIWHAFCVIGNLNYYQENREKYWMCGICIGLKKIQNAMIPRSRYEDTQTGNKCILESIQYHSQQINKMVNPNICGIKTNYYWSQSIQLLNSITFIKDIIINNYQIFPKKSLLFFLGIIMNEMNHKHIISLQPYEMRIKSLLPSLSCLHERIIHLLNNTIPDINNKNEYQNISIQNINMDDLIFDNNNNNNNNKNNNNGNYVPNKSLSEYIANIIEYSNDVIIVYTTKKLHFSIKIPTIIAEDASILNQTYLLQSITVCDFDHDRVDDKVMYIA